MKKLLLILFVGLLFCANLKAQELKQGEFTQIIEAPGKNADELYKLSLKWISLTYKNPEKVLLSQVENETLRGEGVNIGAVVMSKTPFVAYNLKYEFKIDIKDSKVRIVIYNMRAIQGGGNIEYPFESYLYKKDGSERTNPQAKNVKESTISSIEPLLLSFENVILGKETSGDKW